MLNIKKFRERYGSVDEAPLEGNVLYLCPSSGEITNEETPFEKGHNINSISITLISIPTWCKKCHPQPDVKWSRSGATARPHIGQGLMDIHHFDKGKGYYVTDGYYCSKCKTFYVAEELKTFICCWCGKEFESILGLLCPYCIRFQTNSTNPEPPKPLNK